MLAGDLSQRAPMLIVGFDPYLDFFPYLCAENLSAQAIPARGTSLDLESLRERRFTNALTLANLFEAPEFRAEVVRALRPRLGGATRVGFPAVLGLKQPLQVIAELESGLGVPVFEIPGLPPSIPGIRLHRLLVDAIRKAGGQVQEGLSVASARLIHPNGSPGQIEAVISQAAARRLVHSARSFVLATGGFLGGGSIGAPDGSIEELIFDLPLVAPRQRADWFQPDFFNPAGHPVFRSGVRTDGHFRPLGHQDELCFDNLFVVGAALSGCDPIRERSYEGIAISTGFCVGERLGSQP
jgi:glycerol-3-phosphate dehydrogenase subunit B